MVLAIRQKIQHIIDRGIVYDRFCSNFTFFYDIKHYIQIIRGSQQFFHRFNLRNLTIFIAYISIMQVSKYNTDQLIQGSGRLSYQLCFDFHAKNSFLRCET